jgi:ribosomal protein L29
MSVLLDERREHRRRVLVRDMSIEDANKELVELRRHLFDLRLRAPRGEIKDVREFARTRKCIAMVLYKMHMADIYDQEQEFIEASDEETTEAEEAAE